MTHMRKKALVVEDDPETQRLLSALLDESGCVVDTASDGAAAIEMLAAGDYDVVLLDIVLPRVSGTEVMEFLADSQPETLSKIIVVTGLNVEEIRRLFPTVAHTLGKPVVARRLMQSVALCLSFSDGEFTQR
jgi:CheY-like chemotaxis protein